LDTQLNELALLAKPTVLKSLTVPLMICELPVQVVEVKRVHSIPDGVAALLISLAWPLAAVLLQPTGKVVAVQVRQLPKLTASQVVKTRMASAMSPTGRMFAPLATAAAAGDLTVTDETKAALMRAKRVMNLNMVNGRRLIAGSSQIINGTVNDLSTVGFANKANSFSCVSN